MQSLYGHAYHQRLFNGGSPLLRPHITYQPFPVGPGKNDVQERSENNDPNSPIDLVETLEDLPPLDLQGSKSDAKPDGTPQLEPDTKNDEKQVSIPIASDEAVDTVQVKDGTPQEELKDKEAVAPWHREDGDKPPAYVLEEKLQLEEKSQDVELEENPFNEEQLHGKLLPTPSRLLKFLLPLPTKQNEPDSAPLAFLVHPQQPLSYLERLIQSELPKINGSNFPDITFRALDIGDESRRLATEIQAPAPQQSSGSISPSDSETKGASEGEQPSEIHPESDVLQDPRLIRWSLSTEIGNFIREASKGTSFIIEIQPVRKSSSSPTKIIKYPPIIVSIPTFESRTYLLRSRLRDTTSQIKSFQNLKNICDKLAHRPAQRMAVLGLFALISYWAIAFRLTFMSSLGWDVMEPITYLTGLGIMVLGYLWLLWNGREVNYHILMRETVSRRQMREYERKGLDIERWEQLVDEGKEMRKEIRKIAEEYGITWQEQMDEVGDESEKGLLEEKGEGATGREGKKD